MKLINGKVRLSDLAQALQVSNRALLHHLNNNSGLNVGAEQLDDSRTSVYLLQLDSILKFLHWLRSNGKKVNMETISRVEEQIRCLMT